MWDQVGLTTVRSDGAEQKGAEVGQAGKNKIKQGKRSQNNESARLPNRKGEGEKHGQAEW